MREIVCLDCKTLTGSGKAATVSELGLALIPPPDHLLLGEHVTAKYDLRMTAKHNGKQISDGNMKDMNWTFAEIIERASYGVRLLPGDVIGSGTVGTGCYLELNGTWALDAKEKGKDFTPIWLKDGDEIELEITGLGILKNTIRKAKKSRSILAKKKKTSSCFTTSRKIYQLQKFTDYFLAVLHHDRLHLFQLFLRMA